MADSGIEIFGSCVTRDAFEFDTLCKYKITAYYARSSLISLYSDQMEVSLNDIKLESNFERLTVYNDLTNDFRKHVTKKRDSYLIIDFIDERIAVLQKGASCFTQSAAFLKSGYDLDGKVIRDSERTKLWKESASLFIKEIASCYDPQKIILHKAFWKHRYVTDDGKVHLFKNLSSFLNNKMLGEYYQFFETALPGIKTIEIGAFHASKTHKWGLEPFHYQDEYYINFLKELSLLIS